MKKGFTLIELSIALVIIGLIVGGILVGRDLIKAAEIRAQIKQIEDFTTAANAFKIKYNCLPGDLKPTDANQLGFFTFTGVNAGKSYLPTTSDPADFSPVYAFGDGNGSIDTNEAFVFWQHLSEAKMIPGQYGGTLTGTNYLIASTADYNTAGIPANPLTTQSSFDLFLPKSKITTEYYHVTAYGNKAFMNSVGGILNNFNLSFPNIFDIGSTANQSFLIDSKIDDGFPDKGKVRAPSTKFGSVGLSPCVTALSPNTYDLSPATANSASCGTSILW